MREKATIIAEAKEYIKAKNLEFQNSDYYIDEKIALKAITFISLLRHTGGKLAGSPFALLPFQIKFITDIIGTYDRRTAQRRYKTAVLFIPRKNGKTELIAALLNYFLFVDSEKGKEIYCAANETDQARIIFNAATTMIAQNSTLSKNCEIYKSTRSVVAKSEFQNFIKVLTANAQTKDGLKPYVFVYDELHAAKDGELWRVLDEGTINRTNPLSIIISTAGYNLAGEMKRKYDYAKQVEQGIIKDDSFYSMIFEADSAKWQDESEWVRANPALGYGVQLENLRTKYTQTIGNAENEMSFKTKHLNIWCNSSKAWINDEIWCAAPSLKELEILEFPRLQKELEWYGGLDLSSTGDITAYTLIAKFKEHFIVKPFFWLPSDNASRRARNDRVPYIDWINKGLITATDGNVIDYAYLKSDIERINSEFNIKATAYDRWNSAGIITELANEGLENFTPFGQGFGAMSQPAKEIYALAMKKQLVHGGNPVLRWMISNVEILTDPAGNIKLAKNKSREKIDGVVALVMAYGVYSMLGVRETSSPSVRILEF